MGSILVDDIHDQTRPENEPFHVLSTDFIDGDGFKSFTVTGIASDQTTAPTGMRDEILLLSWLIMVLRTREGSQMSYDWTYKDEDNPFLHEQAKRSLPIDKIMRGSQNTAGALATAISHHITTVEPSRHTGNSNTASIILSTSSLSKTSENMKNEGILHLEVRYHTGHLKIRPVWHTENILQYSVTQYIDTLVDIVKMCILNPDASIEDCIRPISRDLDEIWRWNHLLPPLYQFGMHEMISERARKSPDKVAIASWDGDLTYAQVEQYSTFVACSLKEKGVNLHDVLPVCFEKSRWAIIAVLAVMKTGATFVLMDPSLPLARLQNMTEQAGAKMMVSSRKQHDLSKSIMPSGNLTVVEAETFEYLSNTQFFAQPIPVSSCTIMYIIFTSGSTGTPKGVKISHETYTSSAIPRAKAVGYSEESRVLDFASYAFDVSIDSMLLTLGNGGCLCIPSDEDRLNDINGVIRKMQVNYAGLTPSVARILDPNVIASLSGLGLGGEAASARDVTLWGQDTRIIIGYGPCECTIGCTVNSSAATGRDYISIGTGNGAAIWIVDPSDHESLVPVGAVGELLVEGPIVGQGYLNDPEKTIAAFIEDPSWLVAGHKDYIGRRGRLYKTGDLGKYDPDGSGGIIFVGRKDTQVKLRGQRVELGEIESQLRERLFTDTNVIAEVIVPLGSRGQPMLVAFIAFNSRKGPENTDLKLIQLVNEQRSTLSKADTDLAKVLPRYMIPTAYIPINYIPDLISGKTDRKRLRSFGATVDLRQLDQGTASTETQQLSDVEQRLRQAWGQTLNLSPETILPDDNFFLLGGDSLAAMRLVSVCRLQGLDLTVVSTFGHPTLTKMAEIVHICDSQAPIDIPTFSMISQSTESACLEASQACASEVAAIEDIYPCTPTQESLFTFSLKSNKAYVAQRIASIPSHISFDDWKKAWEGVVAVIPILRTRLAQLQEPGLQQVVVKESISWRYSTDLAQYLETDRNEKMELGKILARYALISDPNDSRRYMVWTVHHVLYDGWSEPLILEKVSNALSNDHIETEVQMRDFVKYVRLEDEAAMQEFWREGLKGAVGPQFPRLPSRDYLPTPDSMLEHHISVDASSRSPFTMATLIRGAWALVASQYTGSDDVVFGETLTGRDIPFAGVERIIGPLIATLPVRIRIDRTSSVESYLHAIQQGMLTRTPYQHMGMQNIRKVSPDAQQACETGTGLVIQPESEHLGSELGFDEGDVVREALHFNPYPLMLACGVRKGGFRVCVNFDSNLIEVAQMERILAQLEMAFLELTRSPTRKVGDISCLPEAELNQIWEWNRSPPLSLDESLGRVRADASIKQGSIYPRVVVPWVCQPQNPYLLSPIGCIGELWLEGAVFSGESIESPAWLVAGTSTDAGRKGKVQPTSDLVYLREDGSLIFVSRKENVLLVQGHALDVANFEAHLTRHLPPTIRAAPAVFQSLPENTEQILDRELAVFIEQPQLSEEFNVELMSEDHNITCGALDPQNGKMRICPTIPISLAMALKQLDKFIQDSLPSYMMPSTYVVVDKLPTDMKQINHSLLNKLASRIPRDVLAQLVEGFKKAWMNNTVQTDLTAAEDILRSSWAKILGMSPAQIDVNDNFFRLGGDSVLAMKLVSSLRARRCGLTVADVFQHMRLSDAAKVLKLNQVPKERAQPYKAFSALGDLNVGQFLAETIRPQLAESLWCIQDVYSVTNSQALDIRATINAPRTSIQYTMLYFDKSINREQLLGACNKLVKTHDILRTVFIEYESNFFQVVLDELNTPVTLQQVDIELEHYVVDFCTADIESNFLLGSSFLKMYFVEDKNGQGCLIIGLSHAQYDGISLPRLLRDLETLYTGQKLINFEPFSSYMARVRDTHVQTEALRYWRDLLNGSSLSVLNEMSVRPMDKSIFHAKPLNIFQHTEEITTANLLTAAWALVLARRLRVADVTFGSVTSGRNIDLANVENVMGPCYQLTPVRVSFQCQWTVMDLLRFVQKQSAESVAHDFLGFEKISKQCTQWSSEVQSFHSVVHHQDFEDFDTMPFAEGVCRVEISNPHGDAAYPLKAVSFVKSSQIHVGVVGSEDNSAFVDAILHELVGAVQELAVCRSEDILLDSKIFQKEVAI